MARLKRNDPLPLHVQLLKTLRADIDAERLAPHQRLPSERDLCLRFDVSRMTVRQALAELAREGLIYSRVGKGTFVSEPKIDQQLKTLSGFSEDMNRRGSTPSSRVLQAKLCPVNNDLAQMLRVPIGTEIVLLTRVGLADGLPLAIETTHHPHYLCPNLLQHDFSVESLYAVLEREYGLRLTRADQTIESRLASSRELSLLHLVPPAPLLVMQRLTFTDQEVLIEYVQSAYRGDRYKFRSSLAARPDRQMTL